MYLLTLCSSKEPKTKPPLIPSLFYQDFCVLNFNILSDCSRTPDHQALSIAIFTTQVSPFTSNMPSDTEIARTIKKRINRLEEQRLDVVDKAQELQTKIKWSIEKQVEHAKATHGELTPADDKYFKAEQDKIRGWEDKINNTHKREAKKIVNRMQEEEDKLRQFREPTKWEKYQGKKYKEPYNPVPEEYWIDPGEP